MFNHKTVYNKSALKSSLSNHAVLYIHLLNVYY